MRFIIPLVIALVLAFPAIASSEAAPLDAPRQFVALDLAPVSEDVTEAVCDEVYAEIEWVVPYDMTTAEFESVWEPTLPECSITFVGPHEITEE